LARIQRLTQLADHLPEAAVGDVHRAPTGGNEEISRYQVAGAADERMKNGEFPRGQRDRRTGAEERQRLYSQLVGTNA
jgi:hypothetical protein